MKIPMKKNKHLKIVEQIIIVILFSVLTPMIIAGLVVNNINQHAIRKELSYSAMMIAQTIDNNIRSILESDEGKINEIVLAMKYLPSEYLERVYLKDVMINSDIFADIEIVHPSEQKISLNPDDTLIYDSENKSLSITEKIHDDKFLIATINMNAFKEKIFNSFQKDKRQIYVIDNNHNLVFAHNFQQDDFNEILELLPSNLIPDRVEIFGRIKNQPLACLKMEGSDLTVVVNTTHEITNRTINEARWKIIVAILVATAFIISIVGLYTYYLYINMRQLFKGIMALSKGNYKRQVRLLEHLMTPYEVIFLASEFNKMVNEINVSYKQLKQKNKELKLLDGFRANLVDTVSHEFRTPLTSIKGYTSRLLRQDIVIDKETTHKSLVIIKQQTERLARMVEDLLVIPDIEGAKLNIQLSPVNLFESMESSLISIKKIEQRVVENTISADFPLVYADRDRLEQVFINLIENANKYAYEDSPIVVSADIDNRKAIITIENKADYIEKQVLEKLFDKFTRVDDKTTRTTRGTGLGLYIVKGLVNAMNGSIYLKSSIDNTFVAKIIVPLAQDSE